MAILKVKSNLRKMYGGPYDGKHIPLSFSGTLPFKVTIDGVTWNGKYDSYNNWVDL